MKAYPSTIWGPGPAVAVPGTGAFVAVKLSRLTAHKYGLDIGRGFVGPSVSWGYCWKCVTQEHLRAPVHAVSSSMSQEGSFCCSTWLTKMTEDIWE